MSQKPRYRLATDAALATGRQVILSGNPAHYLTQVLRLKAGDAIALFSRADGEWRAVVGNVGKREVVLDIDSQLRPAVPPLGLTVCFAPIRGGRMETIIEKATELGASVLQPVLTNRSVVDKVNLDRAETLAREAAEQCERLDWPEIREPVKLLHLLGDWPKGVPLVYGDESGASAPITERLPAMAHTAGAPWGILVGPEGGFTPDEFAAINHVKSSLGVGLGPRILRADTAVITLCALTLAAWGDWQQRPRFTTE